MSTHSIYVWVALPQQKNSKMPSHICQVQSKPAVTLFRTHKSLKERVSIRRNRTKRANFRGSPLLQATYNNKTENSLTNLSCVTLMLGGWREEKGTRLPERWQSTLFQIWLCVILKDMHAQKKWWLFPRLREQYGEGSTIHSPIALLFSFLFLSGDQLAHTNSAF